MSEKDYVLSEAGGLGAGQSVRVECPWCHGGTSHEASLSVTRTGDGVLYNCHRGSCGQRGFIGTAAWTLCAAQPAESNLKPYTGTLEDLTLEDLEFFQRRYELSPVSVLGRIYHNDRDEYVLPVSWLGHERGYNVRQPWPGAPRHGRPGVPKSKVWMHADKPVQSAYDGPSQMFGSTVVVEDQLSAIKLTMVPGVAYAVALQGTHMNPARVREIAMLQTNEVIIALDSDATSVAFGHARTYGMAFRRTRVAILKEDLKDTLLKDIPAALGL